jgi:hypothetical protein
VINLRKEGDVPFIYDSTVHEDKFVGEDIRFCDEYTRLWKEGVFSQPIWVWPDLDLNHAGYRGNLHEYLIEKNKQSKTAVLC